MRHLLVSIFLASLAMGIVGLALVLYAKDHLHASYTEIGLLGPAYAVLHVLLSAPSGHLADRYGRRRFIVLGLALTAFAFALYSRASTMTWLLATRLLQGAAEAPIWVNAQSAVAEFSSELGRGRAMGLYGVSWAAGFTIGPFLGGYLYETSGPVRTFLLGAALIAVAAAVMAGGTFQRSAMKLGKAPSRGLWPICWIGLIYYGVVAIIFTLFPAHARQLDISEFQIGVLLALFGGIRAALLLPLGMLSDRFGVKPVVLFGISLLAVSVGTMAMTTQYSMFIVIISFLAASEAITYPAMMNAVSRVGGDENRGYVFGVFNSIATIGWGLLPGIGGVVADAFGPRTPYLMCALAASATAMFVWRFFKPRG
jgi:MFS family permease